MNGGNIIKILFIKEKRSESGIEGVAIYLLNLCLELNKLNIPYLVLYNDKDLYYDKLIENNINVRIIPLPPKSAKNLFHKYKDIVKTRQTIYDIIKEEKITLINVHFPHLLWYLKKSWGIPIVAHWHGAFVDNTRLKYFYIKDLLNPKKLINSFYQKDKVFNFNNADKVICAGDAAQNTAIGVFGVKKEIISLNMYGANERNINKIKDIRKILNLEVEDKLIISAGRETKAKGVEDFCEVAKLFKDKENYKFLYLGGYRDKKYHDILISKYSKYVQFEGMKTNIDEYYKAADLMLFLSHREAGGMVLFESMSFGLPMIVWDTVGVNELVINDKNGFISPMGDLVDVKNNVNNILSDNILYNQFSIHSKEEFYKKYNFKNHVERLLITFKGLNNGR